MKKFIALVLLQFAAAAPLHAQEHAAASGAPWAVVAQTRPTAPLAAVVDARLFVAPDDGAGARDAVYQLRPNRPRSAVIGGLVTGGAAVLAGVLGSDGDCHCSLFYPAAFALGTVPGLVIGGLVGYNLPNDEKPAFTDPASERR